MVDLFVGQDEAAAVELVEVMRRLAQQVFADDLMALALAGEGSLAPSSGLSVCGPHEQRPFELLKWFAYAQSIYLFVSQHDR